MDITCKECQSTFRLDHKLIKSSGSMVRCSVCHAVFRVYPPDMTDRRKFPRTKTRNLIAHISVDGDGRIVSQGLGKALDISKGGMLLETPCPVEEGHLSLMAVDKESHLHEIKGELAYCIEAGDGRFHSGIRFTGTDLQVINYVRRLIKEYNHRKNSLYFSISR